MQAFLDQNNLRGICSLELYTSQLRHPELIPIPPSSQSHPSHKWPLPLHPLQVLQKKHFSSQAWSKWYDPKKAQFGNLASPEVSSTLFLGSLWAHEKLLVCGAKQRRPTNHLSKMRWIHSQPCHGPSRSRDRTHGPRTCSSVLVYQDRPQGVLSCLLLYTHKCFLNPRSWFTKNKRLWRLCQLFTSPNYHHYITYHA